jgi:hypothetical protein
MATGEMTATGNSSIKQGGPRRRGTQNRPYRPKQAGEGKTIRTHHFSSWRVLFVSGVAGWKPAIFAVLTLTALALALARGPASPVQSLLQAA